MANGFLQKENSFKSYKDWVGAFPLENVLCKESFLSENYDLFCCKTQILFGLFELFTSHSGLDQDLMTISHATWHY
jgi:hypothetical protein